MSTVALMVTARTKEGVILLTGKQSNYRIKLLGSTLPTGADATRGRWGDEMLTIYSRGKGGLVAIVVVHETFDNKGKSSHQQYAAFLEVAIKEDGTPWIDLENSWFPTKRVGHITKDEVLAKINGRTYTSDTVYSSDKSGAVHVPDPNIICKYLFQEASAGEVIAAAVEPKLEENARKQLPKLVAQISRMESRIRSLETVLESESYRCDTLIKREEKTCLVVLTSGVLYEQLKKIPEMLLPGFVKTFLNDYRLATDEVAQSQ